MDLAEGSRVVIGATSHTLVAVRIRSSEINLYPIHTAAVWHLSYSPDGSTILGWGLCCPTSCTMDSNLGDWDPHAGGTDVLNVGWCYGIVLICLSPNSITPTLRQSPGQVRDKVADLLRTQIMKVHDTNHVVDFHDLCRGLSWFVFATKSMSLTLSPTFPMHCNGLNSIRATQTGLSRTCHRLRHKYLDMSRWFVSATRDLCRRLSPKLHGYMISHRLCLQLSWFVSMTFPAVKFRWKLA